MYGPLNLTPQKLALEAQTLQEKLRRGLTTLREVDDVEYGATRKQFSRGPPHASYSRHV